MNALVVLLVAVIVCPGVLVLVEGRQVSARGCSFARAFNAVFAVLNVSIVASFLATGNGVRWLNVAAAVVNVAGVLYFHRVIKETNHGSDRGTEAGPQDPGTVHRTFATGGIAHTGSITITGGADPVVTAAALRAAVQRHYQIGERGAEKVAPDLEVVESDMPILAHRIARLRFDGTTRPFRPLHRGDMFGVDADAVCAGSIYASVFDRPKHSAPDVSCSCGFYALPSDVEPWGEGVDFVTLMVELSGTVIEHEKGYRAKHQRVVECQIPACPFCGRTADVVDVREHQMVAAYCQEHVPEGSDRVLVSTADVVAMLPVPVTLRGRSSDA